MATSVAVASRLYAFRDGELGGAAARDVLALVDTLLSSLAAGKGQVEHGVSCRMLAEIVRSLSRCPEAEGRLSTVIDRLPALLESFANSSSISSGSNSGGSDSADGLLHLLDALLGCDADELVKKLNRTVPKLTACAVRAAEKDGGTATVGLTCLLTLLESQARALLRPSASAVRRACLAALHRPLAAEVAAALFSIEPPEQWGACWAGAVASCAVLLQSVGLYMHGGRSSSSSSSSSISGSGATAPLVAVDAALLRLHGYPRALGAERAIEGCCRLLHHMLRRGCCSGPVALDLSALCPLLTYALAVSVDVDDADARSGVENEQGVAPRQLRTVLPQIKTHLLAVLTTLMSAQPRALLGACSALLRPMSAAVLGRDAARHPPLRHAALLCFKAAVQCFPAAVAREAQAAVAAVVDWFTAEVGRLCAPHSSVLSAAEATAAALAAGSGGGKDADGADAAAAGLNVAQLSGRAPRPSFESAAVLFDAVETLLLHSGHLLAPAARDALEVSVGQALATVTKGVLCPMPTDRHLRRAPVEVLRETPLLQCWLLRVACAEALTSTRDGVLSGNVPLLARACEACLLSANYAGSTAFGASGGAVGAAAAVGTEAMRVSLAVGALLHPAAVPLPAVPAAVTARKYQAASAQQGSDASAGPGKGGKGKKGRQGGQGAADVGGEGEGEGDGAQWRGAGGFLSSAVSSSSSSSSSGVAGTEATGAGAGAGAEKKRARAGSADGPSKQAKKAVSAAPPAAPAQTQTSAPFGSARPRPAAAPAKGGGDDDDDDDDDDDLPEINMDGEPDK